MEIDGEPHGNSAITAERLGIHLATMPEWARKGLLPTPVKLGAAKYYNLRKVDRRVSRGEK